MLFIVNKIGSNISHTITCVESIKFREAIKQLIPNNEISSIKINKITLYAKDDHTSYLEDYFDQTTYEHNVETSKLVITTDNEEISVPVEKEFEIIQMFKELPYYPNVGLCLFLYLIENQRYYYLPYYIHDFEKSNYLYKLVQQSSSKLKNRIFTGSEFIMLEILGKTSDFPYIKFYPFLKTKNTIKESHLIVDSQYLNIAPSVYCKISSGKRDIFLKQFEITKIVPRNFDEKNQDQKTEM